MHVLVEGPQPIHGTWTFEPDGDGTRVRFTAEGKLRGAARMATPLVKVMLGRQMARYHANLRANLEVSQGVGKPATP